jgi:hypothetical protein
MDLDLLQHGQQFRRLELGDRPDSKVGKTSAASERF